MPALADALAPAKPAVAGVPSVLAEVLCGASVELHADLASTELSVAELLALRPGDILRLDQTQTDPVAVRVEGVTKFLGQPMQRGGVFGVEVTTEVS